MSHKVRKEWDEVKAEVVNKAPSLSIILQFMEDDLAQATSRAQACDERAVGFACVGSELTTSIRKDAESLRAKGVIAEDLYSRFTDELYRFKVDAIEHIIRSLGQCLSKGADHG